MKQILDPERTPSLPTHLPSIVVNVMGWLPTESSHANWPRRVTLRVHEVVVLWALPYCISRGYLTTSLWVTVLCVPPTGALQLQKHNIWRIPHHSMSRHIGVLGADYLHLQSQSRHSIQLVFWRSVFIWRTQCTVLRDTTKVLEVTLRKEVTKGKTSLLEI